MRSDSAHRRYACGCRRCPRAPSDAERYHSCRGLLLRRRLYDAVIELIAAIGSALIPVSDRIRRKPGVSGERFGRVVLGAALRPVAVTKRRLVVPERARVVGSAEENL